MVILVLAAHPDDEVLGCGATLLRWMREGHFVHVAFAGRGRQNGTQADDAKRVADLAGWMIAHQGHFPDQQYDCVGILALAQWAERVIGWLKPDRVLIHAQTDTNQDHEALAKASIIACRGIREVWAFEVPGSTPIGWTPHLFKDVSGWTSNKIALIREYKSEYRESPHSRSLAMVEAKARLWGSQAGCEMAEAFQILRQVV